MIGTERGVVRAGEVYSLPEFKSRTGMSQSAFTAAKRAGLSVFRVGKRAFVSGDDFMRFLDSSKGTKN